jgi:hypothetical protein
MSEREQAILESPALSTWYGPIGLAQVASFDTARLIAECEVMVGYANRVTLSPNLRRSARESGDALIAIMHRYAPNEYREVLLKILLGQQKAREDRPLLACKLPRAVQNL